MTFAKLAGLEPVFDRFSTSTPAQNDRTGPHPFLNSRFHDISAIEAR
jgi:hypothetical protein